ncbi:FAD-dependent monooxygenase [Poseidonocella sp. HB161398]|uniref:FAD-dependent monooxygenase n=1 Tax=Poseidonocella sp. HB161398 TaxID=2320855 RepID=UPI001109AF5E|nr:FAD-dependent monooxygenase [Poseidonocella sp. HB161398]
MADILVAGAGPAGSLAALLLARQGARVVLADPGRPVAPRCESLAPAARALMAGLGLEPVLAAARLGQPAAMALSWRAVPEHRRFGAEAPWLLSRPLLHAGLRAAALAAGAVALETRITRLETGRARTADGGMLEPAVILDARGRAAGGLRPLAPARAALPFAGSAPEGAASMGIAALEDGWIWWAEARGQRQGIRVAAPATLSGMDGTARQDWLQAAHAPGLPDLSACSAGRPVPAGLAAAPETQPAPGVIRLGDAALARDPVAAQGLLHALRSASQAAAAAATLLWHPGEAGAAEAFLRLRHQADCEAAIAATAAAQAGQARHATPFWRGTAPAPEAPAAPPRDAALRLAARPARVPLLAEGHIRWTRGLELDATGQPLARVGPYPAAALLAALAAPGTAPELAARLARLGPATAAGPVIAELLRIGALVPGAVTPA